MDQDPFAEFLRPPANETPSERQERLIKEAEQKRVSDAIDEQIRQEKQILQKQKSVIKILLLGQSESGKSTTLKNFRLEYARGEWEAEKASWRAVIQLNLVRSILSILETLQAEIDGEPLLEFDDAASFDIPLTADEYTPTQSQLSPEIIQYLQLFRLRLATPLRHVEKDLKVKLGAGTEEVTNMDELPETPIELGNGSQPYEAPDSRYLVRTRKNRRRKEEMVVRGLRWREFLSHGRKASLLGLRNRANMDKQDQSVAETLAVCKDDMKTLWMTQIVREILKRRRIDMENNAGFFLNDIDRIASTSFVPSDDDVVRSRLRTVGVQEYRISLNPSNSKSGPKEWILYDVGGSRTMRRAWIPFFEDVNAIIFLAPISCFDEKLLEDPNVNRLNDSIGLWKAIIASKMLQNTTMICFLNKCDILKRKLRSGIQFRSFVKDYGDKPNDVSPVVKFIKERFKNIAVKYTVNPHRMTYIYTTSVTDTKATAATLKSVRDSIFREHLAEAGVV